MRRGGTPLSRWVMGGDLYGHAAVRTKAALRRGDIKGIQWHQGESDASTEELANTYARRLEINFIGVALRLRLTVM